MNLNKHWQVYVYQTCRLLFFFLHDKDKLLNQNTAALVEHELAQ